MIGVVRSPRVSLRRFDGMLLVAVAALCVIGALLVWSSTRSLDTSGLMRKHLFNLGIGLALAVAVGSLDHRWLRAYAPILYGGCVIGLVLVLTPLGATVNGSHSWIIIGGGFQVQPSELAKPAMILMMALLLAELPDGGKRPRGVEVILALGVAGLPALLIMLQPDFGTTMVLMAITGGLLVLAGVSKRWIFGLLGVVVAGALAVWAFGLLESYQLARFTAFADPSADPRGVGYNARQALIAIGSGELFGKGLFQGGQTNGRFVPEQHTDFVFTVAGEEFGFLGAVCILALLGVVLLRGLHIARVCEDRFGALVAGGIVCWLGFQAFINIGMTLGIMPITGLPLPFVSYGGTATFANMIAIGLLQSIHTRSAPSP